MEKDPHQRSFLFLIGLQFLLALVVGGLFSVYILPHFTNTLVFFSIVLAVGLISGVVYFQYKLGQRLKLATQQLDYRDQEAFITLYEHSPLAYFTTRKDGVILECNPAGVHLLKGTVEGMRGINLLSLIEDLPEADFNQEVLAGKIAAGVLIKDVELPIKTLAGEVVWVLLSVFVHIDSQQRLVSLVDVTEKKIVDTAKSEFVALATHQLRTPIAAIRWNVELLRKKTPPDALVVQEKYLVKIERNIARMIELINDFLSVSKLEMGTFATNFELVNISEFITSVADEFSGKISEKNISLHRVEEPSDLTFQSDPRLLHIVVSNLLSNAVKYLRDNGNVWVQYKVNGGTIEIVIADDGIGIPEKELNHLFTKFYRASNAQAHQTEGTGLGLYAVKQAAEMLGGSISVQSDEEKGARFVVCIPLRV